MHARPTSRVRTRTGHFGSGRTLMLAPTIQQFDLREAAIFETLNDEDLERLNARLVLRRYPRGAPIFFAGDPGTSLCIIRAGRVKLSMTSSDGREVILDLLGRGHVFGEM